MDDARLRISGASRTFLELGGLLGSARRVSRAVGMRAGAGEPAVVDDQILVADPPDPRKGSSTISPRLASAKKALMIKIDPCLSECLTNSIFKSFLWILA
jgi:hypothetical protein